MNSNQNFNKNLNPSEKQKTSGSSESRSEIKKKGYWIGSLNFRTKNFKRVFVEG